MLMYECTIFIYFFFVKEIGAHNHIFISFKLNLMTKKRKDARNARHYVFIFKYLIPLGNNLTIR
jgi:hypothetical protein